MYHITIFHYHLQTGGITQVIGDSVLAMLTEAREKFELTLVSGREEQSGKFLEGLKGELDRINVSSGSDISSRVRLDICPMLDYTDNMKTPPKAGRIKKELLSRYGGTVWWVHNYHIGKNPVFTGVLLEIARENPGQQIVLHIHDFPESGRFTNLEKIRTHLEANNPGKALYPDLPNVKYVVINGRDRNILTEAGISEDRVFLLNNPIRPADNGFIDFWQVHDKINRWAEASLPFWRSGGKIILYPVRTIRRKNVLEAGLLVNLLDTPSNLLVTLPGTSAQEQHYSGLVARTFSEKLVPGAWAVGTRLEEFQTEFLELTRAADLIISTSVQEGFGYLFINSLLWSVPLLARDLDILVGIKKLFSPESSHFYNQLMVPLDRRTAEELKDSYRAAFSAVQKILPGEVLANLTAEMEKMLANEVIDFSYLTPEQQYDLLVKLKTSAGYRDRLRELNAEIVAVTENLLRGTRVRNHREVLRLFGPAAHAAAIIKILESFSTSSGGNDTLTERAEETAQNGGISYRVLKSFSHIDYFRPLYFA